MSTTIIGSGSYVPKVKVENSDFIEHPFYMGDGKKIQETGEQVISKFEKITGIKARRYISDDQSNSSIAYLAGKKALEDSKIDPESLDLIIVAHNFGDIIKGSFQTDIIPSIASRVKHLLGIENPNCIPHDIIFGCPGWVQGLIHAHAFIQAGLHKRCLIIGAEVLSRILDPFDRDTMIFADGAGAVVVEAGSTDAGILSYAVASHTTEEVNYLSFGPSYSSFSGDKNSFIKMQGRKIYEYALSRVPQAMKDCFDKSGLQIDQLDKILIHQANEKMDEAIVKRFYRLYSIREIPQDIMPMTIGELGNSSVATIPTLLDLIRKEQLDQHAINKGDIIMFASVGAGMNINAVLYKV